MNDFLTYVLIFASVVALIKLFSLFYSNVYLKNAEAKKQEYQNSRLKKQKTEDGKVDFVRCPLCSTPLAYGEDLFTRIFRPMNTPNQRLIILGCPHCYPSAKSGVKRNCPVCKKEVPLKGNLIARLFNKTSGKKHVIITGCTVCYGPKK